jgi:hypothetical protein
MKTILLRGVGLIKGGFLRILTKKARGLQIILAF